MSKFIQRKKDYTNFTDITITSVKLEKLSNPGCNNGQYPEMFITTSDGMVIKGNACRCGNGCSNTSPLAYKGESLSDYLHRTGQAVLITEYDTYVVHILCHTKTYDEEEDENQIEYEIITHDDLDFE